MRKMTQGSIARHLIAYALPLILGNLFQLTYNAVDSIVIGSRGLSGVEEFLLGSVSSKVSQYAKVPVVVVK